MNLIKEAEYWRGYRKCFLDLYHNGYIKKIKRAGQNAKESEVYNRAVLDFVSQSWENMRDYVIDGNHSRFVNHKRDEKGKLIYCEVEIIGK
jgi:predicted NAD-dependent protein-ADP-ribosyltransferase YbiA (DUF1768 family)